jgi:hypothetical protein
MTDLDLGIPPFLQRASQMKTIENGATPGNGHVAVREPVAPPTPMDMISRAIEQGAPIEVVERLMSLRERWEANEARKAFDAALALARSDIKPIAKNRHVGFDSKKPGAARTDYRHEDLAEVARTIDPVLGRYGLSYRFRTKSLPNEPIIVTCIIFGHGHPGEETTLSAGRDDSGNKNSIQQMGSTVTYLQRYTLKAALGLAAANDDDGNGGKNGNGNGSPTITDAQVDEINKLLIETKSNLVLFLKRIKLESLTEIRADKFAEVVALIRDNAKRREQQS